MMSSLEQIMNSIEDKKAEEECDQNSDGSVDFYQWPSSMSCRLSQTFTNSASSSTTTTTSYTTTKDMRSDILSRANSSDESNSVTDTSVTNSSSTTSSKTYTYDTAFRLDYSTFATKYGEQYRDDYIKNRYNYLNADTKENAKLQEAFSDSEKAVYNTIAQNINIKLTPQSSIDLDNYDDNSQYYIDISSTKDL